MGASDNDCETRDISKSSSIELTADKLEEFLKVCEKPEAPNQELKDAFKAATANGLE